MRRIQDPAFPTDGLQATDFWSWLVGNALFEDKMIGLFSLLFGAGFRTAQMIPSARWLRSIRFGPLEWLWRSATYRGWQGMRVGE